jgi:hypothetical protein
MGGNDESRRKGREGKLCSSDPQPAAGSGPGACFTITRCRPGRGPRAKSEWSCIPHTRGDEPGRLRIGPITRPSSPGQYGRFGRDGKTSPGTGARANAPPGRDPRPLYEAARAAHAFQAQRSVTQKSRHRFTRFPDTPIAQRRKDAKNSIPLRLRVFALEIPTVLRHARPLLFPCVCYHRHPVHTWE